jgi:hypothetical protein
MKREKRKEKQKIPAIVCERRLDLLFCSLPLHRHSYIGFILAFAFRFIINNLDGWFSQCTECGCQEDRWYVNTKYSLGKHSSSFFKYCQCTECVCPHSSKVKRICGM